MAPVTSNSFIDSADNRSAYNKALISVVSDIITLIVLAVVAWQSQAWQLVVVTGLMMVMTAVAIVGVKLIKQGREVAGGWLVISVPLVAITGGGLLVADLGIVTGIIAVVVTGISASQLLPSRHAGWAVIASVVVAGFVIFLDQINPAVRFIAPAQVVTLAIALTSIVVLGYLVIKVKEFRNYSLRTKMIISFLVVSVLSMVALTFTANRVLRQSLTQSAEQRLSVAALQVSGSFDAFVQNNLTRIKNEASLPMFVDFLGPTDFRPGNSELEKILRNFSQNDIDNVISYGLLDRNGINVVDSVGRNLALNESDQAYFKIAFDEHRSYVSPVIFSERYQQPILVFSTPVHNVLGQSIGVLRAIYKADIFQALIENSNELAGPESYAILLDENQLRLANGSDASLTYKLVAPLPPAEISRLQAAERLPQGSIEQISTNLPGFSQGLANTAAQGSFLTGVHPEDVAREHEDWVVTIRPETKPDWQIAFLQPPEVYLAPVESQTRVILISMMVILAVVAAIAFGLGQYIAGPILRLTRVAEQITVGDFSVQAPVESKDETGRLASVFNTMTDQLRDFIGSLEAQVRERTNDLALSMEIGQQASAIRELEPLLKTVVSFLEEQFKLDVVQVYLMDDLAQNLVVAETSQNVELSSLKSIALGDVYTPGQAAARALPDLVPDTRQNQAYVPLPSLPDTRSHLAVPLLVEQQVIGVLDLHANTPNTFTPENLTVYEAVATQLAISIDSARQWALSMAAQTKTEQALRQLTQQRWAETLQTRRQALGYTYNLSTITPASAADPGDVQLPLTIQNQQVGKLSVSAPPGRKFSEDEQELLAAVAQQLAQKAENLRLFNQTQQRATREQLARQITEKIRASRDVETALKVAAAELSQALGTSRAVIDLQVSDSNEPAPQATNGTQN